MVGDDDEREGGAPAPQVHALLEAVSAISSDLDLRSVLTRIVEAATELTAARFGALGVISPDGSGLSEFVTTGIDARTRDLIGDLPRGRGILGLLIDDPRALRLRDLTSHPDSAGFPAHHPAMNSFLGVPIRVRGTAFGNLYLTEKAGGREFDVEDERLVEALARAAGFVIENARAYRISEQRRRWLEATADLTSALAPPADRASTLQQVVRTALRATGAHTTALLSGGRRRELLASEGSWGEASSEELLTELARVLAVEATREPTEVRLHGSTALAVPLRSHLAEVGVLVALWPTGGYPLDVEDRELLASFADQAGLALDRAQAIADREELAVISDRERIARDLHDVVIQRLFATGLQLQGISMLAAGSEVAARLEQAVADLDVTIRDIRGTIFELQQRSGPSLRHDVRALVREYVPVLGSTPHLSTVGPVDTAVGPELATHLLAVLREAISNVARHALADRVEIELRAGEGELVLRVADDGGGLPPDRTESGLRNARRRARDLGGTLDLAENHPRGTVLTWRAPLTTEEQRPTDPPAGEVTSAE